MLTQSDGESVSRRVRMPTIFDGSGSKRADRDVERRAVVDDARLGLEARRLAFVRLALDEAVDHRGVVPGGVVEFAVEADRGRLADRRGGHGAVADADAGPGGGDSPPARRHRVRSGGERVRCEDRAGRMTGRRTRTPRRRCMRGPQGGRRNAARERLARLRPARLLSHALGLRRGRLGRLCLERHDAPHPHASAARHARPAAGGHRSRDAPVVPGGCGALPGRPRRRRRAPAQRGRGGGRASRRTTACCRSARSRR